MKVLILGSGSFAGLCFFVHLLKSGFEVHGVNRSKPKESEMWPWIRGVKMENIWHTYNIINDLDRIIEVINSLKPDTIIDFMGQGMVAQSWDDPALWYETNLGQKSKLINYLAKSDYLEQYIRASTPEVYGSNEAKMIASSTFNPSTPYAISHAAIDTHLRCMGSSYQFPFKIARFANFYGVGQQLYRVIPRIILSCLTNTKFIMDGKGNSVRSFINTKDICSALDAMIKKAEIKAEYNFSSEEEISITKLIDKVCEKCNVSRSEVLEQGPERVGKDKYYRLDCSATTKDLGWSTEVKLDNGINDVIEWIGLNLNYLSSQNWKYEHRR